MRLTQIDTFLIRMLYLYAAGIVTLTVVGMESAASALFYLTFVLVVLLWLSGAQRRVLWTDVILIFTIGLSLANVIVNATLNETAVSFGYLKKYLMFVCTLIYFLAAHKLRIDDRTEKFLLRINSFLAIFLTAYFFSHRMEVYLLNNRFSNYLTFGFTNPNLTALFLMCLFTGELYQVFRDRSILARLWHLCLAGMLVYFVWETESRNCLMTMMLVTVLCVAVRLIRREFALPGWFSALVTVWPILFVAAYMFVMGNARIQEAFSFMVSEGKGLDARLSVWRPALRYFGQSPVFGAYSQISRGTGMSQMHNTHLDILVSYGTVILVLVCWLLYSMINSRDSVITKEDTITKICFCGTIIMGMGEAAIFSGGLGVYLFAGVFLLLCNKERKPSEAGGTDP